MSISGLLLLNLVFNIIHHVVEIRVFNSFSIFILLFLFAILSKISIKVILRLGGHISNFFKEGELNEKVICRNFRQTTKYGVLGKKRRVKV